MWSPWEDRQRKVTEKHVVNPPTGGHRAVHTGFHKSVRTAAPDSDAEVFVWPHGEGGQHQTRARELHRETNPVRLCPMRLRHDS